MPRLRGGDRHPEATQGKTIHDVIAAKNREFRPRGGGTHSGEFHSALTLVKWTREGWMTASIGDKNLKNQIQTNIGRNPSKWEKKRMGRYVFYRNVEKV